MKVAASRQKGVGGLNKPSANRAQIYSLLPTPEQKSIEEASKAFLVADVQRQNGCGGLNRPVPNNKDNKLDQVPRAKVLAKPATGAGELTADYLWDEEDPLEEQEIMSILKVNKQWLADHRTRVLPIIPHAPLGRVILYPSKRGLMLWIRQQMQTRPRWQRTTKTI
jgi:hypothetical protein